MMHNESVDQRVRLAIYQALIAGRTMPTSADLAGALSMPIEDVEAAFSHVTALVPEPTDPGRLRMAKPFSAVPTPFAVTSGDHSWWANCIWDALGVAAIVRADVDIASTCGDCGVPMELRIRDGQVLGSGVVHFGTPARDWWKDIVYT